MDGNHRARDVCSGQGSIFSQSLAKMKGPPGELVISHPGLWGAGTGGPMGGDMGSLGRDRGAR